MSALLLRTIACLTMLVDHIGLMWGISWMRAVGRIAFPIFAFLLVNGYRHTKNLNKYAIRLGIFALLSEIPFDLLLSSTPFDWGRQNIFFTLFFGLLMITLFDMAKEKSILLALLPVAVFCAAAMVLNTDYGYLGILTVFAFHLFYGKDAKNITLLIISVVFLSSWQAISYHTANLVLAQTGFDLRSVRAFNPFFYGHPAYLQTHRIMGLVPILMYNGKKGFAPKPKWAAKLMQYGFYAFYPVHILILYLLRSIGG